MACRAVARRLPRTLTRAFLNLREEWDYSIMEFTVMERDILGRLSNPDWGDTLGWDLWSDEEDGIAVIREFPVGATRQNKDYQAFKRGMDRLAGQGLILKKTGDERRVAKAVWTITEAGQRAYNTWLKQVTVEGGVKELTVDDWVGKRVTSDRPIPRDQWRELMRRHKAGELDLAFLRPKSED